MGHSDYEMRPGLKHPSVHYIPFRGGYPNTRKKGRLFVTAVLPQQFCHILVLSV